MPAEQRPAREHGPIRVAVFNFQAGGLRAASGYDFTGLRRAFESIAADLILLCEGKGWGGDGKRGLLSALAALDKATGLPYVGELARCERGDFGPAVLYNPVVLRLRCWHDATPATTPDDKYGMAEFEVRHSGTPFLAIVQHWHPRSLVRRRQEAEAVDRWGEHEVPVILGGDLNETASGEHLPRCDWTRQSYVARSHRAVEGPPGVWTTDTAAVDHLIGRWDPTLGERVGGAGFAAVNELAARLGTPAADAFRTTVNTTKGGGLLVDWLMVNRALRDRYVPGSYFVQVPAVEPYPSDHRLVTAAFDL